MSAGGAHILDNQGDTTCGDSPENQAQNTAHGTKASGGSVHPIPPATTTAMSPLPLSSLAQSSGCASPLPSLHNPSRALQPVLKQQRIHTGSVTSTTKEHSVRCCCCCCCRIKQLKPTHSNFQGMAWLGQPPHALQHPMLTPQQTASIVC